MSTESLFKYICRVPEIKYILLMFFSTRIVLNIIGVLSRTIMKPHSSFSSNSWLAVWGVWDTGWYMDISQNGYTSRSLDQLLVQQTNIAFFPLYPSLMRFLGSIIGNHYIAGIIVSNFCLIVSCVYLYRLVRLDSGEANSIRSIKYLLIFPTSFILSGVFSESLYLALTLMCFYYARKGKWHLVGITGFCLSLTRSIGVLVILPLLYELLMQFRKEKKEIISFKNPREIILPLFYLAFIPLGIISYMIYNYYLTGDFLAFAHAQVMWGRHAANPLVVLIHGYHGSIYSAFEAAFAAITIFIFILFYRKIRFSYWLFGMYSIFVPLSTGIMSMPRFILVIFPLYILFADITKNHVIDEKTTSTRDAKNGKILQTLNEQKMHPNSQSNSMNQYSEELVTLTFALFQGFLMVFWTNGSWLVV